MKTYRHRIDTNQTAIIAHLRAIGCSVFPLSSVGGGCPDLLVGINGQNILIEVKSGKGKLTTEQTDFLAHWRGRVFIARSVAEAEAIVSAVMGEEESLGAG